MLGLLRGTCTVKIMREYHAVARAVTAWVWVPHVSGLHVGSWFALHAEELKTLLWPRGVAFSDFQLLPQVAVAAHDGCAKYFRACAPGRTGTI